VLNSFAEKLFNCSIIILKKLTLFFQILFSNRFKFKNQMKFLNSGKKVELSPKLKIKEKKSLPVK